MNTIALPLPALLPATNGKTASAERTLRRAEAISVSRDRSGQAIRALTGTLWITQEGDREDYIVEAPGVFIPTRTGRVVVESLTPAARFVFGAASI